MKGEHDRARSPAGGIAPDHRPHRVGDVDEPRPAPWAAVTGAGDRAVDLVGDVRPVLVPELDRAVRARARPPGRGWPRRDQPVGVRGRVAIGERGHVADAEATGQQREEQRLPSLETWNEWMPEPLELPKPWAPLKVRGGWTGTHARGSGRPWTGAGCRAAHGPSGSARGRRSRSCCGAGREEEGALRIRSGPPR